MIAVAIGLLILAGMTTLFVSNSKAQTEIEKANRQVENGRYAVSLLAGDLRNAGYYGEFDPTELATPAPLPDPCALTIAALKDGLPLHVQGYDNAAASVLSCLTDVKAGTDVLVLRHARTCVAGAANCDAAQRRRAVLPGFAVQQPDRARFGQPGRPLRARHRHHLADAPQARLRPDRRQRHPGGDPQVRDPYLLRGQQRQCGRRHPDPQARRTEHQQRRRPDA